VPVTCPNGHTWRIRISAWYPVPREVKAKISRKVQQEIKVKEREVEALREKYFDLREELIA